jgi:hypothetical protein
MLEFYKTLAGKHFFDSHIPRIVRALEKIAEAMAPEERGDGLKISSGEKVYTIPGKWEEGPDGRFAFRDPYQRLLAINGCEVHIEAIHFREDEERGRIAVEEKVWGESLDALYVLNERGPHQAIIINGKTCEIFVMPVSEG